ncbi:MAG: hypothetical protein AAGL49_11130, partial [Pseudomonadota bacterium]
ARAARVALWTSGAALLGLFALFVFGGLLAPYDQVQRMGTVSLLSLSLAALSVVGPAAVAYALYRALRLQIDAPIFRAYALFVGFLLAGAWALIAVNGWVPLITWRM